MKILFQGDSVTDAGRDRSNPHDMGEGYPRYASAMLADAFSDEASELEFINLAISGNRTEHLCERLESDFVEIQPDIVSLLIGINDVWHHYSHGIETTDEQFEARLRTVLDAMKTRTTARILLIQPFLLEEVDPGAPGMREELARKQAIFRRLADEYADAYLPLDEILHTSITEPQSYYSLDGVHPTPDGACFIGEACLTAISPLVEALLKKETD